ncbi:DUF6415 family natural product biosynthesis protein [Streptomyces sp. NPDC101115]|uniref:DUF6415 family natural product biosynthesis protein n=1 Tax=Streptomyces sp. NPDC101115 TaxID=3366106 RepID=UPI003829D2E8
MDEQPQHDRPAEHTVEVPLAPLMSQIADRVEDHIAENARLDIARARSMVLTQPGAEALAKLTDRLIQHCTTLAPFIERIPDNERPPRGTAALQNWARLRDDGPEDGPLANHSYARHLAYAARDMLDALGEHRRNQQQATFVGRTELPPVRADAP